MLFRSAEARRQIADGLARAGSPSGKKAVQDAASNVRLFPPRTPPQDPPLPSERVPPAPGPYAAPSRDQSETDDGKGDDREPDMNGPQKTTPSPAANGAAPMSRGPAEQTYDQTIQDSNDIIRDCEQELARLKARKITQKLEQLASSGLDPANLGRASDIDDALKEQEKAAQKALDTAQSFRDGLQRDHGGMNESHQSAPVKGAQPEFYEG